MNKGKQDIKINTTDLIQIKTETSHILHIQCFFEIFTPSFTL